MNFKTFKQKHAADFEAYNAALTAITEKRKSLSKFKWQLSALREFPELISEYLDQNSLYDPESNSRVMTREQMDAKYAEVTKKLSYPVTYDPAYRDALRTFLSAVYEDAVQMMADADRAVADAQRERRTKEAELYRACVDALDAKYALQRELTTALFAGHDNATSNGDFVREFVTDMIVDPANGAFIPSDIKSQLDARLSGIGELDAKLASQDDPELFQRRYDSAFAQRNKDALQIRKGLAEAKEDLFAWISAGNPV